MDSVLVEYLNSGAAWLLVGSGPSIEMGYPGWSQLALTATELVRAERDAKGAEPCEIALRAGDYPAVFEAAQAVLGPDRLREALRGELRPRKDTGEVYKAIAAWPVAAYLTTNYDNEIARHLSPLGESFETYSNSSDHMSLLVSDTSGVIVRLHGDLTSSQGLVLTASQYRALAEGKEFEYWRTRLTSLFQMQRVIVIGHSLTDPHIRAVLEAAKRGASAERQVCWIAPDVPTNTAIDLLERYRIRVISYPSSSDHRGLLNLVKTVSQFVVPRVGIKIRKSVAEVVETGRRGDPGATAVYVFNRVAPHVDLETVQAEVALAAAESVLPQFKSHPGFTIDEVFDVVGWPAEARDRLTARTEQGLIQKKLVLKDSGLLSLASGNPGAEEHRAEFDHLRLRFLSATRVRIRRECPWIGEEDAQRIAADIDASLIGFFRRGGLTLSTLLFGKRRPNQSSVPASVMAFIAQASALYDDLSFRQAFWMGALGAFCEAGQAEREYLGRIAQGFFAFHAAGIFGNVAVERARNARSTVWLVDSSVLIPALALGSPSNSAYVDMFRRLHSSGVRVFTTHKLFNEAYGHLGFAQAIVRRFGGDSYNALAAAVGDAPYRKQNLFLQGFLSWQQADSLGSWESFLHAVTGSREPGPAALEGQLRALGVEVIDFQDWPGFSPMDFAERDAFCEKLKQVMRRARLGDGAEDQSLEQWMAEKTPPEAEAAVIVLRERAGDYHVLAPGTSPSWFISATSIINVLRERAQVTWQPEAFLAFVGTLVGDTGLTSFDHAFEVVVWGIGRSGLNPVPQSTIEAAFGSVIDQAVIEVSEQQQAMTSLLGDKYAEPLDRVLARIPPSRRMIGALQLSKELVARQQEELRDARNIGIQAQLTAKKAQTELDGLTRFRRKLADRQALNAKRKRQASEQRKGKRR